MIYWRERDGDKCKIETEEIDFREMLLSLVARLAVRPTATCSFSTSCSGARWWSDKVENRQKKRSGRCHSDDP